MAVEIFSLLHSIGNSLLSLFREGRKENREHNDRIASLCGSISECLTKIAANLQSRKNPRAECRELAHYLQRFQAVAGKDLAEDLAAELRECLRVAHIGPMRTVEFLKGLRFNLAPEVSSVAKLESDIAQIEEAAGSFRAAANLLRAEF